MWEIKNNIEARALESLIIATDMHGSITDYP